MSFGLGISFSRLCRKSRTLEEIYENADRRIVWEVLYEDEDTMVKINRQKHMVIHYPKKLMIRITSE